MNAYKAFFSALALSVLGLTSCSHQAQINGTFVDGADQEIIVRQLDVNKYNTLDTIKTSADGKFKYSLDVQKGEPEFIYLFAGENRVAALLLENGEKVSVTTNALGDYTVEGSEGSAKLAVVDKAYTQFVKDILAAGEDSKAVSKLYIDHYRASVKYVMENPFSLTVIPVLYENLGQQTPIFGQATDALFFRKAADSLKTVYPDSRYVKALDKEAARREQILEIETQIRNAQEAAFPEINLPDINGERKSLTALENKAIILHFWDASDAAQKMLNLEVLLPLYNSYAKKGLEIYSVCVSPDKAQWGSVVKSQKLPWINVNDGKGAISAVSSYNLASLPTSILIINGEMSQAQINSESDLKKELNKVLR
ncbi:MAG: AhpC/TSA family protein [Bacteroidales bacterium]|nr:AhpC/TSA family protein [Bacteroidales bacterium]